MAKLCEYGPLIHLMKPEEAALLGAIHLLQQGTASMISRACLYDGPDGLCCAAAPFLPFYDRSMESVGWANLASRNGFVRHLDNVIFELQCIHDHRSPALWGESLVNTRAFSEIPWDIAEWSKEKLLAKAEEVVNKIKERANGETV